MAEHGDFRLPEWFSRQSLKYFHCAFVAVYVSRGLMKLCLVWKNMVITRRYAEPPDIYEIPGGVESLKTWSELRHMMTAESNYILIEAFYDLNLNVAKIVTNYYPYLWSKTAEYGSTMMSRAVWFTAFDFFVNEFGRLIPNVFLDAFSDEYTIHSQLFTVIPMLASRIILIYISVMLFNLVGLKVIAIELILYRIIRLCLLRPLFLPTNTMRQALEQQLPGSVEIMDVAISLGYPTDRVLLDQGGSRPPLAMYHNFFIYDRLVITKNLLLCMDPEQAKGIVAHELCHWKYGHAYVNHICRCILNCSKFYFYMMAYEHPRFAEFFRLTDAHPIIPLMLAYSTVWPVFNDIAYGFANLYYAAIELSCDDFACKVTDPISFRGALVKTALYRESHPFDGWFSAWFHGMPSLMKRIRRVDEKIQKMKTKLTGNSLITANPLYIC